MKASFFLNGMEGDIVGFESGDNIYEKPEYRVVENAEQFRSLSALIFQNLAQIEAEIDLKNALEVCHVAVCFKSGDVESTFMFLPVFPKNFRISENYSSWVQLKSIVKNGDAGTPSKGTSFSVFLKQKLAGCRLTMLLLTESSPEKFSQSHTILEEASKLANDLRSIPASSASRRKQSDSLQNSRHQQSERSSQAEELDEYARQVADEVAVFVGKAENILESGDPATLRLEGDNLKRQLDILEQKVEIATESSKAPMTKQRLIRSKVKLVQLKEEIESVMADTRMNSTRHGNHRIHDTFERPGITSSSHYGGYRSPKYNGLPPKVGFTATKKKGGEIEAVKRFKADDYRALSGELEDFKQNIYSKIERVKKSRQGIPSRKSHEKNRRSGSRRSRDLSSSSSGTSSSSRSSRSRRKKSRSRSILGRLKGDLAECDNLQQIKFTTVLRDKQNLESTNREFAGVVKDMKKKLENWQDKYHDLDTKLKLMEVDYKRTDEEAQKHAIIAKQQAEEIKELKKAVDAEKDILAEKKLKWKNRFVELEAEIDRLKEQNITLENKLANYEQLTASQDTLLTEEREKMQTVEGNLSILRNQLDEARKEAIANQEKSQVQETELAEMTVRLQYEVRNANELKNNVEKLTGELQERDLKMEELKKDHRKKKDNIIATKNAEISKATQELSEAKSALQRSEARCSDLEASLEEVKERFDDTMKQLNIAEVRLTELVKEKETVLELKSALNDKGKDLDSKREYAIVGLFKSET